MSRLHIKGGRVIDPANGIDKVCDVLIVDGKIKKVGSVTKADARDAEIINAKGMIVAPGLIDIHVHCREPGHEEEETIASASAAAVAGGFTTICAMPNTHPAQDDERAINYVLQRSADAGLARVLPVGCITKNRDGKELAEMALMCEAGVVAFSDDGNGVDDSKLMHRALQYASMFGISLMQHCQDSALFGGVMNSGPVAVRLGLGGIASAGEEIMLRRDLELVAHTKAPYHMQHASSAGSVDLIREAKSQGLPVTAEATPHHLLLTDAACMEYDPNYKVNPPLRSAADVEALRCGVADGTIDCLATDHAPHSKEEKEHEFALAPFGIISLDCALGLFIKALVESKVIGWPELIKCLTVGPAKVINKPLGTLGVGAAGDVTIIDPNMKWTVDVEKFVSKSRNCPYHGWELTGRAVATIVGGKIKFRL